MEYIVHVIDRASQHKKENLGKYSLLEGKSEKGEECDMVESDYMYLVDEKDELEAVTTVANIIKIKNSLDENVSIAEMFCQSGTNMKNMSIDDDSFVYPQTSNINISENTSSELLKSSFTIERLNSEEKWLELHEISFYVMSREKMLFVK